MLSFGNLYVARACRMRFRGTVSRDRPEDIYFDVYLRQVKTTTTTIN